MNDAYVDQLIHQYLDDCLTPSEMAEFESLLLRSELARKRFWELAEVHGLSLRAIDMVCPDSPCTTEGVLAPSRAKLSGNGDKRSGVGFRGAFRISGRAAMLLGLGVILGVLTTGVAWGIAFRPSDGPKLDVLAESFESTTPPLPLSVPETPGIWSGDYSTVVGAEQEIHPVDGEQMLRFLRADYEGKRDAEDSYFGDVYQLIDLRPLQKERQDGLTEALVTAKFNAVAPVRGERYGASIGIYALTHDVATNTKALLGPLFGPMLANDSLAMSRKSLRRLDESPSTWEQITCELSVPAEAEFLLIHLCTSYASMQGRRVEFDGHYMDDVHLTLSRKLR